MYSEVKGYICCSVPDMLAPMWTGLTMAGVLHNPVLTHQVMDKQAGHGQTGAFVSSISAVHAYHLQPACASNWSNHAHSPCCHTVGVFAVALIICTYFYISKIDHAPRKDCCGCTCHTRSKYAGAVCPNAEQLPQYATPGWEQTPGYVPPNGAMAMHVPWIGAPEHGTVNVVVAGPGGVPKAKAF